MNPFVRDVNDFKRRVDPTDDYVLQAAYYLSKKRNISLDAAKEKVVRYLKSANIVDPVVSFGDRQENNDVVEKKTTLTKYIKDVINHNYILAPSYTVYYQPTKKKSVFAGFINVNLKERSRYKTLAKDAEASGDMTLFGFNNTLQQSKKIFNNSLSGAFTSPSAVQFPPSHYTLTSVTRIGTSVANMLNEAIIGGTFMYNDPSVVLNHFLALLTTINHQEIADVIKKYGLATPTPKDVLKKVLYNTNLYFKDLEFEKNIEAFLETLNDIELSILMYDTDLYHIEKLNPKFIKIMLTNMSKITSGYSTPNSRVHKEADEYVILLVKAIMSDRLKGVKVNHKAMTHTEFYDEYVSTVVNIKKMFEQIYADFIKAFFSIKVIPPNVAYTKDMTRRSVPLSDTDSTVSSYGYWVKKYFGVVRFDQRGSAIAGVVSTFSAETIGSGLKNITTNMGVAPELRGLFEMKSEFTFPVIITTNVAKHYFALISNKEGFTYKEPNVEIKGVSLIASTLSKEFQTKLHDMIKDILMTIYNNGEFHGYESRLSVRKYIDIILGLEKDIEQRIHKADPIVMKTGKIKAPEAYKDKNKDRTPFYHYLLWENVFADKYGHAEPPQLTTYKINVTTDKPKIMLAWVDSIKDESIKSKLQKFLQEHPKDQLRTFYLPKTIVDAHGIPEELVPIIDTRKMVRAITAHFYMVLSTLGVLVDKDELLQDRYI